MNTQDFLTYLFDAIAFGYVAILLFDLGSRLGGKLLDIFASSPTAPPLIVQPVTPVDLPSSHPADEGVLISLTPLEVVAEERVLPLSVPLEVVADPWAAVEIPTLPCCHTRFLRLDPENLSHAAIASPPQLLLAPALEVGHQPDLAAMPNTELRKLCQSAGIKWRNAHGTNKHLSKPEMLAALGS